MEKMTQNDYEILASILDKNDEEKGVIPTKGTTVTEILSKTNLSRTKIGNTLAVFLKYGLVEYGLSVKNAKSFILSDKGMKKIFEIKGDI